MSEWKVFRTTTRKIKWESDLTPTQEDILNKPPIFHLTRVKHAAAKVEFCQNKLKLYSMPHQIEVQNAINEICRKILLLYPDLFE